MKQLRLAAVLLVWSAFGASNPPLDRQFTEAVKPVIAKYCVGCHSGNSAAAQFDLKAYDSIAPVLRDYPRWELVLTRLTANEMPPKQAPQPPPEARQQIVGWIQAVRAEEIRQHTGDPGPVLNRRLSNAEYNYTIRDLTGVDLRPAREFPVDPARLRITSSSNPMASPSRPIPCWWKPTGNDMPSSGLSISTTGNPPILRITSSPHGAINTGPR